MQYLYNLWQAFKRSPAEAEDDQRVPITAVVLIIHFGAVLMQLIWFLHTDYPLFPVVGLVITTLSMLYWIVMRQKQVK